MSEAVILSECPVCGSGGQITSLVEGFDPTPMAQARIRRINGFREQMRKSIEAHAAAQTAVAVERCPRCRVPIGYDPVDREWTYIQDGDEIPLADPAFKKQVAEEAVKAVRDALVQLVMLIEGHMTAKHPATDKEPMLAATIKHARNILNDRDSDG